MLSLPLSTHSNRTHQPSNLSQYHIQSQSLPLSTHSNRVHQLSNLSQYHIQYPSVSATVNTTECTSPLTSLNITSNLPQSLHQPSNLCLSITSNLPQSLHQPSNLSVSVSHPNSLSRCTSPLISLSQYHIQSPSVSAPAL